MDPLTVLRHPEERRLRAGWRLPIAMVAYLVAIVVATLIAELLAAVLGLPSMATGELTSPTLAIMGTTQLLTVGATTVLLGVALDRRRLPDFGFRFGRDWWLDLGFGLALGVAVQTGVFALALAAGWIRVVDVAATADPGASFTLWILAAAIGYIGVGIYEELLARGYLLRNLAEGLAWLNHRTAVAIGILVSSVVFAGLHGLNPNVSAWAVGSLVIAGVMLAMGFVLTGELAIPIGIHITWNFAQGAIWGFPVSGIDTGVTVVAIERTGGELFTGGTFGPEAGLLGLAAKLLSIVAIVAWVYRREGTVGLDPRLTEPTLRNQAEDEPTRRNQVEGESTAPDRD